MLTKSRVKYIQSLSQKKERDSEGIFVAEGPKSVGEFLSAPNTSLVELYAAGGWMEKNGKSFAGLTNVFYEVDEIMLQRISHLRHANEVVALFRKPVFDNIEDYTNRLTLLLDGIQDPGNLGTILRCADWFGIRSIIAGRECADVFNPKVVQSTMGSLSRVQVIPDDLEKFIDSHPRISVYAASLQGTSVYEMDPVKEGFLLIGNESKGISGHLLEKAHMRVTIPGRGGAESLNASVATGIILSHLMKNEKR